MATDNDNTISKFDRLYGGLVGGNNLKTTPSTVEHVTFTGEAETFVIQTVRDERGDHLVIKFMDNDGIKRIICPPRVTDRIASQREALTGKRRSITGKRLAQERKDRGEMPGFMKGKGSKSNSKEIQP